MNQKATFIFILYEAKSSASRNLRAAQVGFFCQCVCVCVCVCTLQIYTTYTYSIFISCIKFTKSLSRDQNIFLKKTYRRILFEQDYTSTFCFFVFLFKSRHTLRRAFTMSLISGRFQEVVCDSDRVLTKAVSQYCVVWVALLSCWLCDSKANAD